MRNCYLIEMEKTLTKPVNKNFEKKALAVITTLFVLVIVSAWLYSMNLRKTIKASNAIVNVDVRALIEVERLRNLSESQFDNSLTFFLMGSSNLFDEQKKDKQEFSEALANFQKQYSLPKIPEIIQGVTTLQQQEQDFFTQGMEFRAKQTESKIVGQFYRSKAYPIRNQINKALDEILVLHNAELERVRAEALEAAVAPEIQIPKGMLWFTILTGTLFLAMSLLVLRMLKERSRQLAERTRLYEEAQKAVQNREEVLSAVSQDFSEPVSVINQAADTLKGTTDPAVINDVVELLRSSVALMDDRIKDILDQAKAETGSIMLRLDQLGIDTILDDAKFMMQPLAKQKDIRLEFNSVNPPALAFMDRERVMRVLSNLVGNAIKFSPRNNKVIVKVKSDPQFVYISVKDNGPGIPEKQLSDIFNHFWQAPKTADQGPGIGLAVVKTIVESHGGKVHVESHVGHGSTFTFSLPKRRPVGANMGRPGALGAKQARDLDFH